MRWDIFCKVIDNFGDIGVCWRLCADLASRGEQVRLWVDDASALTWMAPDGCSGVEVRAWTEPLDMAGITPGDVLVEAFGCTIATEFIAAYEYSTGAKGIKSTWINLEYLSAEDFVPRSHGLPSPVLHGPGAGLTKHFFYPGFTPNTGGLLREADLLQRQSRQQFHDQFQCTAGFDRNRWLSQLGIEPRRTANPTQPERLVSLFCYESPALQALLTLLASDGVPTRLLVTSGRAKNAVLALLDDKMCLQPPWNINSSLLISYLPLLSQIQFDALLWACDLNFVRGEDSLVRAIWAGKPFVWQIYPQGDGAHVPKLNAFLEAMDMPESQRQFHRVWNGLGAPPLAQWLPELDLAGWQSAATRARDPLCAQTSLTDRLLEFVAKSRR